MQVAVIAKDPLWIHTISYTPLLRYNEGLASLLSEYFPEGVGISPLTVSHQRKRDPGPSAKRDPGPSANSSTNIDNGTGIYIIIII